MASEVLNVDFFSPVIFLRPLKLTWVDKYKKHIHLNNIVEKVQVRGSGDASSNLSATLNWLSSLKRVIKLLTTIVFWGEIQQKYIFLRAHRYKFQFVNSG